MRATLMAAVLVLCGCSGMHAGRASNLVGRGREYQRSGKQDKAIEFYRKAVAVDPQDAQAQFSLASALAFQAPQGTSDEAISGFQKAVELDKSDGASHYGLAAVLAAAGIQDDAVTHYKEALKLEPKLFKTDPYLKDILKARGMGRKNPILPGERLLRQWTAKAAVAPAAPRAPVEPPMSSGLAPAPMPATMPAPKAGLLDKLRLPDKGDAGNSDAFFTMGMEAKEEGKDAQARFLLERFVIMEKSSASPRKALIQKAEGTILLLNP